MSSAGAPRTISIAPSRALADDAGAGDAAGAGAGGLGARRRARAIAAAARPTAEREGVLTVTCEAAVWAQELELMAAATHPGRRLERPPLGEPGPMRQPLAVPHRRRPPQTASFSAHFAGI